MTQSERLYFSIPAQSAGEHYNQHPHPRARWAEPDWPDQKCISSEELSVMTRKNVNQIRPQRLVARTILSRSFMFSQCQNFDRIPEIIQLKIVTPGETDNKRRLSCRAFNKNIPGSTIEDHWDILVQCKLVQIIIPLLISTFRQTPPHSHSRPDSQPDRNKG